MTLKTQIEQHIADANLDAFIKDPNDLGVELVECDVEIKTRFTVYGCDEGGYFTRHYRSLDALKAGLEKLNPVHIEAIEKKTTSRESLNIRITDPVACSAQCEMILTNKATD